MTNAPRTKEREAVRVNARLDEELSRKVAYVREQTGESVTGVLKRAIELYYERVKQQRSPAEALRASGFIGCAEGPRDLSSRYKEELARSLGRKSS
jgi:hypothetical protein